MTHSNDVCCMNCIGLQFESESHSQQHQTSNMHLFCAPYGYAINSKMVSGPGTLLDDNDDDDAAAADNDHWDVYISGTLTGW
ncbi:unnamed protein product [Gongylonema pulchrum]|uniref:C2H2-type domain-containing protein n=1 Tax=Gongylonema pulchrum TaxID=637853 RepID=A0A183D3A8_9BILA|nr:unnamed protein product [Gongylonema pulchrum]